MYLILLRFAIAILFSSATEVPNDANEFIHYCVSVFGPRSHGQR